MSRKVFSYGLIFSGAKGDKSKNMTSSGTVAVSASNRAALRRRVLTKCNTEKCMTPLIVDDNNTLSVNLSYQINSIILKFNGEEYLIVDDTTIRNYNKTTYLYNTNNNEEFDMKHIVTTKVTNMDFFFLMSNHSMKIFQDGMLVMLHQ